MYTIDALPATYQEEREAQDLAKRLAAVAQQQAKEQQAKASVTSSTSAIKPQTPQAAPQRPPMSRPGSSSILGNIYQGFVRSRNTSPPPSQLQDKTFGGGSSGTCTPATATTTKIMTQAQIDALRR